MRFPHDLYEGKVAQVSHSDYINHIKELATTIWSQARNAQRISQLEAAHYYNIKHSIKRDKNTGDLVLRRKIPTNPTDVPSHLLPRCTGPYRVLKIDARGALLEHCTTGQRQRSSLHHIRQCAQNKQLFLYDILLLELCKILPLKAVTILYQLILVFHF